MCFLLAITGNQWFSIFMKRSKNVYSFLKFWLMYLSIIYFCVKQRFDQKAYVEFSIKGMYDNKRGRSQTMLKRFWLFLTTYPPSLTFSTLWTLTKIQQFCERPQILFKFLFKSCIPMVCIPMVNFLGEFIWEFFGWIFLRIFLGIFDL